MSQVIVTGAPEFPSPDSQSLAPQNVALQNLAPHELAPHEIVPMLIGSTVEAIERELVLQTLARCDGNRTHAARLLGLSVRTMRNKIKQYATSGVHVPSHS